MIKSLQSIQEHIKNAPGSYLSRLRIKFTRKSGLVQNSKIHNELCNEIASEERLQKWMQKRNEQEALALCLIYASQVRGLHFNELERNLETDQKSLLAFLNEASNEMFIWHAKCQGSHVYYGFADFENFILSHIIKNEESPESIAWISNEKKVELYLLFMLSKVQLGKISVNKDYSISHFSKKHIAKIFSNNKNLDNLMVEECVCLLFSFLISEKWVSKDTESGNLKLLSPAYEFLQNNGFRLFSEFFFWWKNERFRNKNDLPKLLTFFQKPISALNAAKIFWAHDTRSRLQKNKTSISWLNLPMPLRELWMFGILKMQTRKKHILTFSLSEFGESIFFAKTPKETLAEPIVASSSNFEWLLSQNNGAFRIFQMSCFAEAKNEEELLRFILSKESFLDGLRSKLPNSFIQDFLLWNKAVPNVACALNEWLHIYNDSSIDTLPILRIRNVDKLTELSAYKPFLACVEEIIPGWGFVIKKESEKKIKEMLVHFSLEPHSSTQNPNKEAPLSKMAEIEHFKLPYPVPEGEDVNFG